MQIPHTILQIPDMTNDFLESKNNNVSKGINENQ